MLPSIERLSFDAGQKYAAIEAAIHLNRYLIARPYCPGKRVLDVACGQGYGAYLMAERWGAADVHAVDISEEAIDSARRHFGSSRITYHRLPAESVGEQFDAESFDLIVSLETFEHLADPGVVLAALRRLLRPDGVLIVSCPNDHWYYRTPDQANPFHVRKYTFDEFREVAERALGPARQYQIGTPIAGYVNIAADDALLGRVNMPPRAMLDALDPQHAVVVPTEETVRWGTCAYFVGVWGPADMPVGTTTSVFACSMDSSEQAHRRAQVESLRDEAVALRSELFDARRDLTYARERLREYEGELAEIRRREQEVAEREQRYRDAVGKAEYRIEQLEREVRHLGLRAAAVQAENEYIREQARERICDADRARQRSGELENELAECQAQREYYAGVVAEWRPYIDRLEAELARSRKLLLTSPYYLVRRGIGALLRRMRGGRSANGGPQ